MKETAAHLFGSPSCCRSPSPAAFGCTSACLMSGNPFYAHGTDMPVEDEVVEKDPTERYVRYNEILGKGATKIVFKGFDLQQGIEVAWNQVEIPTSMDRRAADRLFEEISLLKKLKHEQIMTLYDSWFDPQRRTLNFITEYFPSGTLRQYRKKFEKVITVAVIKRWAWQILEGLVYLHSHESPIIHRDIKADNIFVIGRTGQVKIGDLGLATAHRGLSVVGTPEFMAPEVYDEKYDEKVDIYSFGMCLLELATLEYPYSECRTAVQIISKVSNGVAPLGLSKVKDDELREFIELCISSNPEFRPSAKDLLQHAFFNGVRPAPTAPTSLSGPKSPASPGSSDVSPRSNGSANDHPPEFNNLYSSSPGNADGVKLSRLGKVHAGANPAAAACGTSSDDEVLIPAAVLKPLHSPSHSPPRSILKTSRDSGGHPVPCWNDMCTTAIQLNTQHMVIRKKLLEECCQATSPCHSGLLQNSL